MAHPARSGEPTYDHDPERHVSLRYPFKAGGRSLDKLPLNPPSFRDLQFLRAKDLVDGADVLSVMSGLPVETVGAMRWPDVEAALSVAFELLPPEFVEVLKGDGEKPAVADEPPAEAPPSDTGDVIDLEAPGDDPGPLANFFE